MGAWNHLSRKVYCTFTDLAFQGSRSATALTLWLVEGSYGFGVYDRLVGLAIGIADTYQTNLIGPLGLSELVGFAAVAAYLAVGNAIVVLKFAVLVPADLSDPLQTIV